MISLVLYQPEIPPNTGNLIRLSSNIGCVLHLIEPLGFSLEEKQLRRAGLDYHEYSKVVVHKDWESFKQACRPRRLLAFSTKAAQNHSQFSFEQDDFLVFGPESRGLPSELLSSPDFYQVLRLPMMAHSRSLNLSNAVAVAAFEAWRQLGFCGSIDMAPAALEAISPQPAPIPRK